ncbi:YjiH family protein [Sansalvadorimonas sp. 2012CJ34-2]|uniref:YjiH family protein n=1 Tax=Parendozoicomonas callyspongiae TaxID=2942213 RepID=A0ABT0PES4_9GAMM|nr:YjiH family protein [Sansalvadorimonas sp. 2012CJ34-2]MCL6269879.1 YjiH family protein [Sansalvadorimonas sp. 2012CJ34-2]
MEKNSNQTRVLSLPLVLKSLVPSILGILFFLIPFDGPHGPTVMIGIVGYAIMDLSSRLLPLTVVAIMLISAVGAIYVRIHEPAWVRNHLFLRSAFMISKFWILVRAVGAVLGIAIILKLGPEWLWGENTGGLVLHELLSVLLVFFFLASIFLPLLLDYGLVELVGTMLHRILKPVYKIPGNSGVDIIASLLGDGTVGTLITARQYEKGYYTGREAAIIATTFSVVSISFCIVVVNFVGLPHMFPYFYLTVVCTCLIIGLVLPRIWPLTSIPDKYHPEADSTVVDNNGQQLSLVSGLQLATQKAGSAPGPVKLLQIGLFNAFDIWLVFIPVIMVIASVAMILAETTPIFQWMGSPLVPLLDLLQIPEPEKAAPGVFLGFVDMFLPAILCRGIDSEMTRFIISALSIAQLIYMSEVGVLIMKSSIPLNFWQLLSLFIIRTVMALPIIVLFARFYFL